MSALLRLDRRPTVSFRFEMLEDRLVPALAFQFDYSLDSTGFFSDPTRRTALELAGADLASLITSTPSAITPSGNNTWTAIVEHPVTGADTFLPNLTIPEGVVRVYAGGMAASRGAAGLGGPGGFRVSGSRSWQDTVLTRGIGDAGLWGGSVSFDTSLNWYFGTDANGIGGQTDFYSIAIHELTHVLGFGTSERWDELVQNGRFMGSETITAYGSAPTLSSDLSHFSQGILSTGCHCSLCIGSLAATPNSDPVSMQPVTAAGRRVGPTQLELAALRDLGWETTNGYPLAGPGVTITSPTPTTPAVTLDAIPGGAAGGRLTIVSGPSDGTIQAYIGDANGRLLPHGPAVRPFGYFGGSVRSTTGDVNGDGATDFIVATGPGGGSLLRVLDGRTLTDLVPAYQAFESAFGGGVYLAAGDFNGDGRDEIVVTPDQGGGPRVQVLAFDNGVLRTRADFFGLDDPNFRGGARAAVGDLTGDGVPELIVAAGFGGGPRVGILHGTSVLSPLGIQRLGGDFFAFEPGLRNGAFVTVTDLDGDGYGDLTFGAGPGGGPRVMSLSGALIVNSGAAVALARPLANAFIGSEQQRGGVRVIAKDFDGDGEPEILTGDGVGGELRVLRPIPGGLSPIGFLTPFSSSPDGIYVG